MIVCYNYIYVVFRRFHRATDGVDWMALSNNCHACYLKTVYCRISRRMRRTRHVARMGVEERCIQCFAGETGSTVTTWKNSGIMVSLKNSVCREWNGLIWLRIGTGGGLL